MSSLANAHLQSDQDVAPLLLAAQVLRTDNEALEAARSLAANAREHAGKRDLQRKLPWSLVEEFTRSGLGSLSIAREFGGPQVSFVTLAEVFAIISAADPGLRTVIKYKWDRRSVLESTAVEGESPVIEILHIWDCIQSTTRHVKPCGKQGGPPSKPKY